MLPLSGRQLIPLPDGGLSARPSGRAFSFVRPAGRTSLQPTIDTLCSGFIPMDTNLHTAAQKSTHRNRKTMGQAKLFDISILMEKTIVWKYAGTYENYGSIPVDAIFAGLTEPRTRKQ
ncbi:MAG: hypothetical protein RBR09_13165 [Desulfobulbaceae bacterium]|jgi:hypothetical protein|nr:hypothetical protein [Desulfobulbaceae bacterium]MDY0352200.1 hypothetical protein [Desulfobulbaceae bacterium]